MSLHHQSLVARQRADDLFIKLHQLSLQEFPSFEKLELGSQLRRAAYSVTVNIVESFSHRDQSDRLNYLNVAEASLAEVEHCVQMAGRLGYIKKEMVDDLEGQIKSVSAPLSGLIRSARLFPSAQVADESRRIQPLR